MPDPTKRTNAPSVEGEIPDPLNPPAGCAFSTRCSHVVDACRNEHPALLPTAGEHTVRCSNPAASTDFEFLSPVSGTINPTTGN